MNRFLSPIPDCARARLKFALGALALSCLTGCSSMPDLGEYTNSVAAATQSSWNSVARSVPELGMATDKGTSGRAITIRLSDQKAFLYKNGEVVAIAPASTGREGYTTPTGKHRVMSKDIDHRSSIYGAYRARRPGCQSRRRRQEGPETPWSGLCRSADALLPANRSFLRAPRRPCARLPSLPRVYPAAEPLGQTLLLRG